MLNEVNSGRCTIRQVVHWMSEAPARVWDVVNKGRIEVGYDADLVLVDLSLSAEINDEDQLTKSRWSPWHGQVLTGWPVHTWVMGAVVYRHGSFGAKPAGQEVQFDHARGGYWATAD
jgi:dihydroorotase